MLIEKRITIVKIRKQPKTGLNEDLQWIGSSLGLFGDRDKDKSCFRLFIELLKAAKLGLPASSDELAKQANLSRGTIVHHLNRLIEFGIVVPYRKKYVLREPHLEQLIEDLKKDTELFFNEIKKTAKEIDIILEVN